MSSERVQGIWKDRVQQHERTYRVTFLPMDKTVEARHGMPLLDVALQNGIDLEHNCGGNCACSTCHVRVVQGMEHLSPKNLKEEDQLKDADGLAENSRLACQARIFGDVLIEIPI